MTRPAQPTWDDYRRRRRLFWIAFVGYVPAVAAIAMPLARITGSEHPVAVLALAWMAFFLFAGGRMMKFPCPRCGEAFFYRPFIQNAFTQRCMRCGWQKWAERWPAPSAGGVSGAAPQR